MAKEVYTGRIPRSISSIEPPRVDSLVNDFGYGKMPQHYLMGAKWADIFTCCRRYMGRLERKGPSLKPTWHTDFFRVGQSPLVLPLRLRISSGPVAARVIEGTVPGLPDVSTYDGAARLASIDSSIVDDAVEQAIKDGLARAVDLTKFKVYDLDYSMIHSSPELTTELDRIVMQGALSL